MACLRGQANSWIWRRPCARVCSVLRRTRMSHRHSKARLSSTVVESRYPCRCRGVSQFLWSLCGPRLLMAAAAYRIIVVIRLRIGQLPTLPHDGCLQNVAVLLVAGRLRPPCAPHSSHPSMIPVLGEPHCRFLAVHSAASVPGACKDGPALKYQSRRCAGDCLTASSALVASCWWAPLDCLCPCLWTESTRML